MGPLWHACRRAPIQVGIYHVEPPLAKQLEPSGTTIWASGIVLYSYNTGREMYFNEQI